MQHWAALPDGRIWLLKFNLTGGAGAMGLWAIAAIGAFFVKGLCGFANTLVFTSVLGFASDNVNISPVELVLGFPPNLILAWKERKNLEPKVFIPLMAIVLAGSVPGAFFLKNTNAQTLKAAFGFLVVFLGIEMLLRGYQKKKSKGSKVVLGIIGLVAGVLSGLFGVGALLAAYVGRVTENSGEFKANFSAVFIAENLFRIILYGVLGIITASTLKQSFMLMPFMLAGLLAGMKSSRALDEKVVKKLVVILLIISGCVMIGKNL